MWVLNKVNNFGVFDSMGLMGFFFFIAAILVLKEELEKCRSKNCVPVLEEFIPLKKEIDQSEENNDNDRDKNNDNECSKDKKNWMSSVQLWNNNTTTSNNNVSDHHKHNNHNLNKLETKVLRKSNTIVYSFRLIPKIKQEKLETKILMRVLFLFDDYRKGRKKDNL